jgi:predicted nucleotidyltransferase
MMQQSAAIMSFGLSELVLARINAVFSRHSQVTEVRLYGSRAKGTFRRGSDIDLVIMGAALTSNQLLQIESEIDELALPYQVDLSLFRQIDNVALIEHIERVGISLYQAEATDRSAS